MERQGEGHEKDDRESGAVQLVRGQLFPVSGDSGAGSSPDFQKRRGVVPAVHPCDDRRGDGFFISRKYSALENDFVESVINDLSIFL